MGGVVVWFIGSTDDTSVMGIAGVGSSTKDGLSDDDGSNCVLRSVVCDLMGGSREAGVAVSGSGEDADVFGLGLFVGNEVFCGIKK